jgi:hypothetical protein
LGKIWNSFIMIGVMITAFDKLTEAESELMLKAPVLVCILIAGADGTIDRKEIKEAIAQTQKKNMSALTGYLEEVSQDFEDKLKILIQSYPYESTQRNPILIEELGQLNRLWKKIDKRFSVQFYEMLKELAEKIAASSGGLWGMKTVTEDEARYLQLPMICDPSEN